jgi:hypothetical protein
MYMKKTFLIAGILCFMNTVFAQQVYDALSFSQSYYHLTARSAAMGGASGALTSDFGAVAVNPAAIATYKTSELTFTPEFYTVLSKTDYENLVNTKRRNDVNISHIGVIYSLQRRRSSVRYNMGFAYNKLNALNTNELIQNVAVPIDKSYWEQIATSTEQRDIKFVEEHRSDNGNQQFLFESDGSLPLKLNNTTVGQRVLYSTGGFLGEYALSFGVNLSEKVYVGASAVVRDAKKSMVYELTETSTHDRDYSYAYDRKHEVSGVGFGGKVGVFILLTPEFSVGASVQTPIFYSLTQRSEDFIRIPHGSASANPTIDERYDYGHINPAGRPYSTETEYDLMTPMQVTLSASYAIQKVALLTFDFEMTPYSMTKYSNTDGNTEILNLNNTLLGDSYFGASIRLGGEFYIWEGLSARLGSGFHTASSADLQRAYNIGLGAGYNFGDIVVDLAYVYWAQKQNYPLYRNANPADTSYGKNFIKLSLAYRL